MKGQKLYKRFEKQGKKWLAEVEKYNEEPFKREVIKGKWTVGQVYNFLTSHTAAYHLEKIDECLAMKKGQSKGGKTFNGTMAFMFNKPKIKKLEATFSPKQPEDIAEARNEMLKFIKSMYNYALKVADADKKSKVAHEIYGNLNAFEWYELIIMNYKYFEKYKDKLNRKISKR